MSNLPPKARDITGLRSGHLVAVAFVAKHKAHALWSCACDCGRTTVVAGYRISSERVTSCGCHLAKIRKGNRRTHGHSSRAAPTSEYAIWRSMRVRCNQPDSPHYKRYGARGISVCDQWNASFENFLADMGPRPSKRHSLDRIDNNAGYEPGNCRWASWEEQANNKRWTVKVTVHGEMMGAAEAARKYGCPYSTFKRRLSRGLLPEAALGLSEVSA